MGKNTNGSIGPVCSDCGGEGVWGADPYPLIICAHCSGTGIEPQSLSRFVSGLQLEDEDIEDP